MSQTMPEQTHTLWKDFPTKSRPDNPQPLHNLTPDTTRSSTPVRRTIQPAVPATRGRWTGEQMPVSLVGFKPNQTSGHIVLDISQDEPIEATCLSQRKQDRGQSMAREEESGRQVELDVQALTPLRNLDYKHKNQIR